jgi:hypothetical protein
MIIEARGLNSLKKKFSEGYSKFQSHVISELNVMATDTAADAKIEASNLPYNNPNTTYKRTNNLANSIVAIPYNGSFVEIKAGNNVVDYAAYVEFGTGTGVGIPTYKYGLSSRNIEPYASIFKGGNGKNSNMKFRPYLFPAFVEQYSKALRKINSFKL